MAAKQACRSAGTAQRLTDVPERQTSCRRVLCEGRCGRRFGPAGALKAGTSPQRDEDVPSGVQDILDLSNTFFTGASTASEACPLNRSCGLQKTWGGILEAYNDGVYPGGPAHCEEVVEP